MAIATGTAIALGVAAGTAGGTALAAHSTAGAAKESATTTSNAANYAADQQSKSAAASLAFEQQKDREAAAQFETTQRANYDQWAARESRMNDIRAQLGLPSHPITPYVATSMPGTTSPALGSTTAPGATTPAMSYPGGSPTFNERGPSTPASGATPKATGDPVYDAIAKNYADLGVSPTGPGSGPTDIAYMTQQAKASLAAGERPLSYWLGPQGRIAQELAATRGGGGAPSAPNTLASFLPSPSSALSVAPPTTVRQLPYLNPNGNIYSPTIGSYAPQA